MDDSRLRGFLADSLALWRVAGKVAPGEEPVVAVVQADDGALVWIERASGEGMPCRWLVRWRGARRDRGHAPLWSGCWAPCAARSA
jgi:hypothetical protein